MIRDSPAFYSATTKWIAIADPQLEQLMKMCFFEFASTISQKALKTMNSWQLNQ